MTRKITSRSAVKETASPRASGSALVIKSDIASLLNTGESVGLSGEFIWPIHPSGLANLYRASAEHCRAIQIKAETAFGNGLIGGGADKLDELTEAGIDDLFVNLGLDLEAFGNAFLQHIFSFDGERLIGLRRLPTITMSRYRGGFMQRVAKPDGSIKIITFTTKEITHIRVPCIMGKRYALPTWIGAEGMLELAHSAVRFNASFFKNNAMPEYAVIFKGGKPSKDQKNAIRDFFRNEYGGLDNQHRTLVLTGTEDTEIKIEKLTADMKEADFLKLIDAARDRMPVAHGVPPRVMGIMTAGQLGGGGEVTSQLFMFEHLTLRPKRRWMLNQLRPILKFLNLRPARGNGFKPEELADDEIAFQPLDLTPPSDDTEGLPNLVNAGIITPEQAQTLLPFLSAENGERKIVGKSVDKSDGEAPPSTISATDDPQSADALLSLLSRL